MDKVKVIYGSTTGNTEDAAKQIAAAFGVDAIAVSEATSADFEAELILLGSSTWGLGELQDDWNAAIAHLEACDLKRKKVAVFGTGDQCGFGDTYCDALAVLAEAAKAQGALLVGQTSAEGYCHTRSAAETNGEFCGLALDYDNEPQKTAGRILAWVKQLKS